MNAVESYKTLNKPLKLPVLPGFKLRRIVLLMLDALTWMPKRQILKRGLKPRSQDLSIQLSILYLTFYDNLQN